MNRSRLVLALAVPFGFVAGHYAGYVAAHPDEVERTTAMAGHEYFGSAATIAVPLLVLSLVCALWNGRRGERLVVRLPSLAAQLVVVFTAIELVEHLALGETPVEVLAEPSLWLGLLAQVAVAAVLCALLRLLHRVGAALASSGRLHLPRRSTLRRGPRPIGYCVAFPTTISGRGPPSPA